MTSRFPDLASGLLFAGYMVAEKITPERGIDMDDMQKYLEEQLKDPEFKKEYDALEPEFAAARAILEASRSEKS